MRAISLTQGQQEKVSGAAVQTTAAIVVALATVFSVIDQSKDLAVTLAVLSLPVLALTFADRVTVFFQAGKVRADLHMAERLQPEPAQEARPKPVYAFRGLCSKGCC